MEEKNLIVEEKDGELILYAKGDWNLSTQPKLEACLEAVKPKKPLVWDLSGVEAFDSAGVLVFISYLERFKKSVDVKVRGYTKPQERLYKLLVEHQEEETVHPPTRGYLYGIGKGVVDGYWEFVSFLNFVGNATSAFLGYFISPKNIRYKEIFYHVGKSGMDAIWIIALTSFLVGLVISYQSAVQLSKFGADIFIVDMASISIARELGPLITAIVVAGRSGSAYTAQIGAMKITEEISAMRTMGFDPYYFLILPRMIALMISLPLLTFFADVVGIFGSMFAAKMELGISYFGFVSRLQEVLAVKHFWIGIIKAPFFALIIASVGCYRGLRVSNDTESIGEQTTASVVNSIFFVIACDAIFSVILTQWRI